MTIDDIPKNDKQMFLDAMSGVKPLNKTHAHPLHRELPEAPSKPPIKQNRSMSRSISSQEIDAHLSNYYKTIVNPETVLSYCHTDVTRVQRHALKSGNIPWQSHLDLHCLTADTARKYIVDFIQNALSKNIRCILLIHGKGSLQGEPPVLKNLVNHWLRQIPQVLAFHSAIPRHGGNGALYVLLKICKKNKRYSQL